jgi:two-component system LytT family sensor kinase
MEHRNRVSWIEICLQLLGLAVLYYLLLLNYSAFLPEIGRSKVLWVASFDFAVLTSGIYVTTRFLLPRVFAKGMYPGFALGYVLLVGLGALAIYIDDRLLLKQADETEGTADSLDYYFSAAGMMLLLTMAGVGIKGLSNWISSTRQISSMKEEALRTELALLRSQLNPHFLFNTLNHIFGHIDKSNKTARDMVLRFSDLMRYQLYECDVSLIDILREIDSLQHYIELQRLRRNEGLECYLRLEDSLVGFSIPPLLLLPVVENAFKHMSAGADAFLHMEMNYRGRVFHFSCINRKAELPVSEPFKTNGIGLQNVRRRLELIYPGRHELIVEDGADTFDVQLSISL